MFQGNSDCLRTSQMFSLSCNTPTAALVDSHHQYLLLLPPNCHHFVNTCCVKRHIELQTVFGTIIEAFHKNSPSFLAPQMHIHLLLLAEDNSLLKLISVGSCVPSGKGFINHRLSGY